MYSVWLFIFVIVIFDTGKCQDSCSYCKPLQGGKIFKNCETNVESVIKREGSTVSVVLHVDIATETYDEWLTIKRRTYNGKICGPTIRVKKGDTLKISLVNLLSNEQLDRGHNKLRLPNTTNIHLHGLHISSAAPGDNVFTPVEPGKTYNYTYEIDLEQPAGTYWYHAHFHGSTALHVMSGLSGLLIVDDDVMPKELDATSCPNHCENEVHVLMQSTLQYDSYQFSFISDIQQEICDSHNFRLPKEVENWLMDHSNKFDHYTVNGLFFPTLTIDQNKLQRFRLVNAGGFSGLELEIVDATSNQSACVIKEIAYDGVYLKNPRNQNNHQSYLAIGARADWLVYCNETGTFLLRSHLNQTNKYSIGNRRFDGVLMKIVVEQSTFTTPSFPSLLPERPHFVGDLTNDTILPQNKFTLEFSGDFYINREKFVDEKDYRYQFKVGSVQEWTFINTFTADAHPIHIHVNHFQVISYNDYTGPISDKSLCHSKEYPTFVLRAQNGNVCNDTYATPTVENEVTKTIDFNKNYLNHKTRWNELEDNPDTATQVLGYARKGDWRDVLNLPPLSNITVRFLAHKYDGTVVVHCHVLKHEDLGMMLTLQVVKDGDIDNTSVRKLDCVERNSQETEKEPFYGATIALGVIASLLFFALIACCFRG